MTYNVDSKSNIQHDTIIDNNKAKSNSSVSDCQSQTNKTTIQSFLTQHKQQMHHPHHHTLKLLCLHPCPGEGKLITGVTQ